MFKRKLPAVWPREAVTALLEIIEERKILQLIDGRRQRNSENFKCVQQDMANEGFSYFSRYNNINSIFLHVLVLK